MVLEGLAEIAPPSLTPEMISALRDVPPVLVEEILAGRDLSHQEYVASGPNGAPELVISVFKRRNHGSVGPCVYFVHGKGTVMGDRFVGIGTVLDWVARLLGVPETYSASIAATAPNYTAQCVAAQQAHTTALFIGDTTPPIEKVGEDCSTQGYNPIYVTEGAGFSMAQASTPGLKKNLWSEYNLYPFWSNAPQVQAMNTALDKYYPGLRENTVSFSEGSVLGWTDGLLLNDAVKAGGLTTSATPARRRSPPGWNRYTVTPWTGGHRL